MTQPLVVDWGPTIEAIACRRPRGGTRSRFPRSSTTLLAEIVEAVALRIGEPKVILTGGCFQNRVFDRGVCGAVAGLRDFSLLAPTRSAQRRGNFARTGRGGATALRRETVEGRNWLRA